MHILHVTYPSQLCEVFIHGHYYRLHPQHTGYPGQRMNVCIIKPNRQVVSLPILCITLNFKLRMTYLNQRTDVWLHEADIVF